MNPVMMFSAPVEDGGEVAAHGRGLGVLGAQGLLPQHEHPALGLLGLLELALAIQQSFFVVENRSYGQSERIVSRSLGMVR